MKYHILQKQKKTKKKNKKEIRRKEKKIQARFIKPGNSLWKLDLICEKEKK